MSVQLVTEDEVRDLVRELIADAGNMTCFCVKHDITVSDMSKFMSGKRTTPAIKVLGLLGIERKLTFVKETDYE